MYPRCKYFYNRYITGKLDIEWCENKIKEIIKCNGEYELRKNTLTNLVAEKFGINDCIYVNINTESNHFLKYGNIKNIHNVFEKLCVFINDDKQIKNKKQFNNFMYNNPPGSAKLDKQLKKYICESLYDFFIDNNQQNIIINNISSETYFFLENKCDLLKLTSTKLSSGIFNITKKQI